MVHLVNWTLSHFINGSGQVAIVKHVSKKFCSVGGSEVF